ncbi:MAG: hypothetical protein RB191_13390 [Terriglobia bacterium]|nr:hypothetical protein [Terriglobia bacterium]
MKPVELTLAPEEAEAVWAWLHQYYPDSRDAWLAAIVKLEDAMERAGVPTTFDDGDG